MRILVVLLVIACISCKEKNALQKKETSITVNFVDVMETIWNSEQTPIRKRDSLIDIYGTEHVLVKEQQEIYKKNHAINEQKVITILNEYGWPTNEMIGDNGNWTIANVLQHSDYEIRVKYLALMEMAVKDGKLEPRFLVRAADRIATDKGKLQIYGGQMKYYPETKSFNVWPVYDPVNIDKRRAEIGLEPIADFLKARFDFDWDLEEQIKRSEEFEKNRLKQQK